MKSVFKNRMTQESEKTMRQLRSTYIDMNGDKNHLPDTPYGLFAVTIQPNCCATDSVKLESDFKHILCLYYHWKYGSKWTSLQYLQHPFEGIIERQTHGYSHIHFTIACDNVVDVAIFGGYLKQQFRAIYPKSSIKIKKIYDRNRWENYISPNKTEKDRYITKRRIEEPIIVANYIYQQFR